MQIIKIALYIVFSVIIDGYIIYPALPPFLNWFGVLLALVVEYWGLEKLVDDSFK
jgi:hypothetical protein